MNAVVPEEATQKFLAWNERVYQRIVSWGLGALGFFLLFSTAGTNLALLALVAACAMAPGRIWAQRPWREPVVVVGFTLLAFIVLHTLLTAGFNVHVLDVLKQYKELLVLPLLIAVLRTAQRPQSFAKGLLLGALFVSILLWIGDHSVQAAEFMNRRRISTGYCLAVIAYLLYENARLGRLNRWLGYGGAAGFAATVALAAEGRTGHLVLLALLGCAAFRAAPRRLRYPAAAFMLAVGTAVAWMSPVIHTRVEETIGVLQGTASPTYTNLSTRIRVEILQNALGVARENWVTGTGWAGYRDAFHQVARERHGADTQIVGTLADNPHNEFLMQLGAGGIVALLLFMLWVAWPIWRPGGAHRGSPWGGVIASTALAFALASLFNSALLDFVEGHFYVALLAWLMVRRLERD